MPDDEWLDVVATAERHRCSTKTIWRRIRQGVLPAHTEKVSGRDGRPVIKTLVRVSDLNDAFGRLAQDEHVRKAREAAPPLTYEQLTVIGDVLLDHLRDREAKRRSSGEAGTSAYRSGDRSPIQSALWALGRAPSIVAEWRIWDRRVIPGMQRHQPWRIRRHAARTRSSEFPTDVRVRCCRLLRAVSSTIREHVVDRRVKSGRIVDPSARASSRGGSVVSRGCVTAMIMIGSRPIPGSHRRF